MSQEPHPEPVNMNETGSIRGLGLLSRKLCPFSPSDKGPTITSP